MSPSFKKGQEMTVVLGPIEIKIANDFMVRFQELEKAIEHLKYDMENYDLSLRDYLDLKDSNDEIVDKVHELEVRIKSLELAPGENPKC